LPRCRSDRARRHVAGPSGMADGRCHRPDPRPPVRDAAAARMGHRRPVEGGIGPRGDGRVPPDGRRAGRAVRRTPSKEDPKPVVAHRASPTNIGLSLLATAARDLGWIGSLDTMDRLEATLATMRLLERFRAISTPGTPRSIRPLAPRYISTVIATRSLASTTRCASPRASSSASRGRRSLRARCSDRIRRSGSVARRGRPPRSPSAAARS
jgi:hypothetical protein